jgi:peptidoglycan/LPS O-acetylase OafA/YrhL
MQADIRTTHRHPKTYIPQIDSLRAIAVVAVIIYHLDSVLLPGGFSGVDVFFVISGYVVSASLAADAQTSFLRFLTGFYARRIVRIVPPLLACLVATSIAATLLIPNSWLSSTSQDTAKYAFVGMSNFALIWSSDGYFSPRVEYNPYTHTWSLGVEEQFYVVFPLLFFICERLRRRAGALGIVANTLLGLLLALSLAYGWYATTAAPAQAFYLLPSRFWELACGALLFQLQSHTKLVLRSAVVVTSAMLLGLALLAAAFYLSTERSFPFPWALLAVGGAALTIAGVTAPQANHSLVGRMLSSPALVFIGKLSYSLYLWHWPVMVLLRWTTGLQTSLQMALALALTAILSFVSFSLLENPIRRSRLVLAQPRWRVIAAGLACILLAQTLTTNVFTRQSYISLSVTRDTRTWYPYAWPDQAAQRRAQCKTKRSFAAAGTGGITTYEPVDCKPQLAQPRQLFVIGDSHAGAYTTLLYTLAEENALRVMIYSKGGCRVANLGQPLKDLGGGCDQFVSATIQDIQQRANPGDVVLMASLKLHRLESATQGEAALLAAQEKENPSSRAARSAALEETDKQLSALEQKDIRVIIEAPKPLFKSPPFRCLDWFNSQNPVCAGGLTMSREYLLKYRQPIMRSLDALSSKHQSLSVWDPFPVLCPLDPCAAVERTGPLFFDGDHLSAHGNRVLYPSFLKLLKQLWGTER